MEAPEGTDSAAKGDFLKAQTDPLIALKSDHSP